MGLDKDDIKQLIAILQKGLSEEEPEPKVSSKKNKKSSSTKKTNDKNKTNLFEKMSEFRMHKDDIEIDKKLNRLPPTERSRQYEPTTVRCRVCGRDELINPSLVESTDRYKCNKCSTSAG